jgi:hypothetical protein
MSRKTQLPPLPAPGIDLEPGDCETHWTRFLYQDVVAEGGEAGQRSPLRQGAVLLGLYVAMHLVAGGVLRGVEAWRGSLPPAQAVAAQSTTLPPHRAE